MIARTFGGKMKVAAALSESSIDKIGRNGSIRVQHLAEGRVKCKGKNLENNNVMRTKIREVWEAGVKTEESLE